MIEKFEKLLEQGDEYAALVRDLSESFDCLLHNLIIAKSLRESIIKTYA